MSQNLQWINSDHIALILAPMAGFTDGTFRRLCRNAGADAVVSEFVMANAVLEADESSEIFKTLSFTEDERPMGLQLFGADPKMMADAAKKLEERFHPDFIDLNCGCPSPKIVAQNAGSALLKNLPLAAKILKSMAEAVPNTPVTAKIRIGWDEDHIVAVEAAKFLEDAGASAIAIHGRTKLQGYSGDADWNEIAKVVKCVKIPIIGNGSIGGTYPVKTLRETGVFGIMVGRAALGNPWIFSKLRAELDGKPSPEDPAPALRLKAMLDYASELEKSGEKLSKMRPRLKTFAVGMRGVRKLRRAIDETDNLETLKNLTDNLK
jgi:tRNA-dihydrouridine synthase B